jgi:hypothetical protein
MNRRTLLSLVALSAVLALGGVACSRTKSKSGAPLKELTVDEVATRIAAKDGKTFVYDNNPKDRFQQSHLPGARWLDFKNVKAEDLPSDRTATLVFYCANEL